MRRLYLEHGQPVEILAAWNGTRPPRDHRLPHVHTRPAGPRNVLIRRPDGSLTVRPFRGLRIPPADAPTPGHVTDERTRPVPTADPSTATADTPMTPQHLTDVHSWFGLSYANYHVLPRTLLQSMPAEWQHRFVACMEELHTAWRHIPQPEGYEVTPGRYVYLCDLTDTDKATLAQFGITVTGPAEADQCHYLIRGGPYGPLGTDGDINDQILVPGRDPVPHYNRGRTRITPAEEGVR